MIVCPSSGECCCPFKKRNRGAFREHSYGRLDFHGGFKRYLVNMEKAELIFETRAKLHTPHGCWRSEAYTSFMLTQGAILAARKHMQNSATCP